MARTTRKPRNRKPSRKPEMPRDLLARAFLDIFRQRHKTLPKCRVRSPGEDGPAYRVPDDLTRDDDNSETASLAGARLATASAWVATAAAKHVVVFKKPRRFGVSIMATSALGLLEFVRRLTARCAFGPGTKVPADEFEPAPRRRLLVIARDGSLDGNEAVTYALDNSAAGIGDANHPAGGAPRLLTPVNIEIGASASAGNPASDTAPRRPFIIDTPIASAALRRTRTESATLDGDNAKQPDETSARKPEGGNDEAARAFVGQKERIGNSR